MKSFKSSSESEKLELDLIGNLSRSANHMLRETIWSIHQDSITLEELCNRAKSYATRIFENTSVRVDLEASELDYIFRQQRRIIYFESYKNRGIMPVNMHRRVKS